MSTLRNVILLTNGAYFAGHANGSWWQQVISISLAFGFFSLFASELNERIKK